MIVQISSGQGTSECCLAVKLLFESLKKEFARCENFEVLSMSVPHRGMENSQDPGQGGAPPCLYRRGF